MPDATDLLHQALRWLPAFAAIALVNSGVALWNRPLGTLRYPIGLCVALVPVLAPRPEAYQAPWGMLTTVLTTFVVVTAVRLPDWDLFARQPRPHLESYLWLSFPMVRSRPATRPWKDRVQLAAPYLGWGSCKLVLWQLTFLFVDTFLSGSLPWLLESVLLMLFFVLNLTAAADLVSCVCLLIGCEINLIFDAPLLSVSPRDFWSRRWNRFISRFALKHVALKLPGSRSNLRLIASVFGVSGIFHEYFAWSVGGPHAWHGFMMLFFLIQGLAVWLGTKAPPLPIPPALSNVLCFMWMTLTAPLFFRAVTPALLAFQYPAAWLPF